MNPRLRASDAEREATVAELRRHTDDGRLTIDEFSQRSAQAYAAVTGADLAAVTADLPRPSDPAPRSALPGVRPWRVAVVAVAALAGVLVLAGLAHAVMAGSMMGGSMMSGMCM